MPSPMLRLRRAPHGRAGRRPAARLVPAAGLTLLTALAPASAQAATADAARGYELVTPPGIGARGVEALPNIGPWTSPITPDGKVLLRTNPSLPGTTGETSRTLLVAERGASAWTRRAVEPASQSTFTHDGNSVLAASRELSDVALELIGFPGLPGEPLEPDAVDTGIGSAYYYAFGWNAATGAGSWLTRPQGSTLRDRRGDAAKVSTTVPGQLAMSDDGATTVFTEPARLTADVPAGLGTGQLYRRTAAGLTAIARRPDGTLATTGVSLLGLSADGASTLFSEDYAPQPDASTASDLLLARAGGTLAVNRSRRATPEPRVGATNPVWARLTPDGQTVWFTTAEQLTDDDTDNSVDLYRYRAATDTLELISRAGGGATGGNADDCSTVAGFSTCDASAGMLSRDGRVAYFVAPEQLDAALGDPAQAGLYVSVDGAAPRRLASIASPDLWMTAISSNLARSSFAVTDAGELVFETANAVGAAATGGVTQVWRYDLAAAKLRCLTCRSNGGTPVGSSTLSVQTGEGLAKGTKPFEAPDDGGSQRVTADGSTVFVNSYDRLVPADVNAGSDVYAIDVATGTPHLITTGRGARDAYLLGIDADGSDAFFVTTDTLDPTDDNGPGIKLYDARIGGGSTAPPPPDPCRGAACRVLAEAPPAPGNASQGTVADATAPPEDGEPELVDLSARDRSRLATTGRLTVKATGLRPGQLAALRVRVQLSAKRSVTATRTSTAGPADRSLTVRFSASARRSILAARKARRLPLEVRLDHGGDAPATLTSSIARVRKGR